MPPVSGFGNVLDYLFEIGPVLDGGMGPVKITNEELLAWQTNNRKRLAPWVCRLIIRLSHEYKNAFIDAGQRGAKPPWTPESVDPEELSAVANSLRDSVRALAG